MPPGNLCDLSRSNFYKINLFLDVLSQFPCQPVGRRKETINSNAARVNESAQIARDVLLSASGNALSQN